jgi:hypothetical protein
MYGAVLGKPIYDLTREPAATDCHAPASGATSTCQAERFATRPCSPVGSVIAQQPRARPLLAPADPLTPDLMAES